MRGNLPAALSIAEECLHLAEAQDDSAPLSLGHRLAGQCRFLMGEFPQARAHVEKAIDIYEPGRHRDSAAIYGVDLCTGAAQILGLDLCLLGHPEQALNVVQDVLEKARQLGFVFSLAVALEWANPVYMFRGEYDIASENAEELLQLANDFNLDEYVDIATTQHSLALALGGHSDLDAVVQLRAPYHVLPRKAWRVLCTIPTWDFLLTLSAVLAVQMRQSMLLRTPSQWRNVRSSSGTTLNCIVSRGSCCSWAMRRSLTRHKRRNVLNGLLRSLAAEQAQWLLLRAAISLAQLWHSQGRVAEANELLEPIFGWFTEGFKIRDLKDARGPIGQVGARVVTGTTRKSGVPEKTSASPLKTEVQRPLQRDPLLERILLQKSCQCSGIALAQESNSELSKSAECSSPHRVLLNRFSNHCRLKRA